MKQNNMLGLLVLGLGIWFLMKKPGSTPSTKYKVGDRLAWTYPWEGGTVTEVWTVEEISTIQNMLTYTMSSTVYGVPGYFSVEFVDNSSEWAKVG